MKRRTSGGWRPSSSAREAAVNTLGRSSRLRAVCVFALALGLAYVLYVSIQSVQFRESVAHAQLEGSYVLQFQAADKAHPIQITRSSCERLGADSRVERAGALMNPSTIDTVQLGRRVRTIEGSVTLFPELRDSELALGAGLTFGGSNLKLGDFAPHVTTLPREPNGIDVNSSIVMPLNPITRVVSSCIAVLHPLHDTRAAVVELGTQLDVAGGAVDVRLGGTADNTLESYLDKPERYISIVLGLLGGVAAGIVNRFRGRDFAVYRLSGTSSGDLLRMIAMEHLIVAGMFSVSVSAAVVTLRNMLLSPPSTVLWGLLSALAWLAVAIPLALPTALRNPIALSRDR